MIFFLQEPTRGLGYYFWDKGTKDYVALDLDVYHDLLLFNQ